MSYPAFKQLREAKSGNMDGIIVDRASGGSVRTRSTWDKRRRTFTVVHMLTMAQYEELEAFYDAHRGTNARFDFVWSADKKTYRCVFSGPPEPQEILSASGIHQKTTCNLLEV